MRLAACLVEGDDDDLSSRPHPRGICVRRISSDDGVTPVNNPAARRTCWPSTGSHERCWYISQGGAASSYTSRWCVTLPHTCIISHRHVNNAGILFTPTKIFARENFYPRKLSIDAVFPQTRKFNTTKIRTLTVMGIRKSCQLPWQSACNGTWHIYMHAELAIYLMVVERVVQCIATLRMTYVCMWPCMWPGGRRTWILGPRLR